MKIICLCFFAFLLTISGCAKNEQLQKDIDNSNVSETDKTTVITDNSEKSDETIEYYEKELIEVQDGLVYKNDECGYQLTFPMTWKNWFSINEEKECAVIKFVGKSKTGSIATKEFYGGGLTVFYIVSENYLKENTMDSTKFIGEINDKNYYYCTGTGSDITALITISDSESAVRRSADYIVDQEELSLAEKDWDKWNEMEKDIDDILKNFKAIT